MSVDLEVIPFVVETITWLRLRERWLSSPLTDGARKLIGPRPVMLRSRTLAEIDDSEALTPQAYFCFDLSDNNTIGLSLDSNEDTYTNEEEFLYDFAGHLPDSEIANIASRWKAIGYSFDVTSSGARHRDEPSACTGLAAALAELTAGYVAVIDPDTFGLEVGIYSAESFRQVLQRVFALKGA